MALWPAYVVDRKAVAAGGAGWWSNPATAVGAGPFRLVGYHTNASLDFAPVAHWWRGSTGTLTHIHVDEGVDGSSAVKKYEAGGYDLIGPAGEIAPNDDVLRYANDPTKKGELHLYNESGDTMMEYNYTGNSPFAPKTGITPGQPTQGLGEDQGLSGRTAFSLAINRNQLADVACIRSLTCTPATGGPIPAGLRGYLGHGADPNAPAGGDPAKAKAEYRKWDPTGAKVQGLQIQYNTNPFNDEVWQNVQAQLQQTLGIKVALDATDFPTLLSDQEAKKPALSRRATVASADNPENWFGESFSCEAGRVGGNDPAGFCDPAVDRLAQQANGEPLAQGLTQYKQANELLVKDVYADDLFYMRVPFLIHSYVRGAGYTGLSDNRWTGISVLQH
jgi:ABC-type oligopeptide transport system substrate-binding subunit